MSRSKRHRQAAVPELLQRTASLLHVAVDAYGEDGGSHGPVPPAVGVLEVVCVAKAHVGKWLSEITDEDAEHAFDALDILALAESVLAADLTPDTNGRTIHPLKSALKVAADLLERTALEVSEDPLRQLEDDNTFGQIVEELQARQAPGAGPRSATPASADEAAAA